MFFNESNFVFFYEPLVDSSSTSQDIWPVPAFIAANYNRILRLVEVDLFGQEIDLRRLNFVLNTLSQNNVCAALRYDKKLTCAVSKILLKNNL